MLSVLAFLIGIVSGLRTLIPPAMVSWAAYLGWLDLAGTWLVFLRTAWVCWVLTLLAVGELIADQHPSTPSRTIPFAVGARIASGAISGAALAAAAGGLVGGAIAGAVGAIIGTFGGHAFRARLAASFGNDRPAALIEDALAIGGALVIVASV